MADIVLKLPGFRCERCGHEWVAKGARKENRPKGKEKGRPKLCPHCKSPYWETAKRSAVKS